VAQPAPGGGSLLDLPIPDQGPLCESVVGGAGLPDLGDDVRCRR
jgi:hypothetical protein